MAIFCLPAFSQSLAAPTGVRVGSSSGTLTVYWNAMPGISTYNIYRSTTSGGEGGTPIASNVGTATSGFYYYSNTGLTNGTTYYYQVTAKSSLGESAKSAEVTGTPNGSLPSSAPTHLVARPGTGQVALTWNATTGASWYNLFRSTNGGSTYTLYQPGLTGTSYTDTGVTAGSPYYYYLSAANVNGEISGGNVVSAIPGAATLPAPTGLRVVPASTQLTLYWNPVTGASSYNVYRGTSPGGEGAVPIANSVNGTSGTFSTYANTGLTNGTPYYYTVTAVNSNGEGAASAEATGVPNGSAPGSPSPLAVTSTGLHGVTSTIILNWNTASGATSYDIFRSAGNSSSYTLYQQGVTATTYSDTSFVRGTIYYYYVVGANANGEGGSSNTVSIVPSVSSLPAPTGLRVEPASGQLTLFWNPVTQATSYNVYRSTSSGGEGSVPLATGVNGVSGSYQTYVNTGLTNGTAYYYTVTAVNANAQSDPSSEVSGTPNGSVPASPNLAATAGSAQVVLNWSAPSGATAYNLFRSLDNSTWALYQGGLTGTSYTDTGVSNGVLYYYQVRGLSASGEGAVSNTASATPATASLPAPSGLRAQPSSGQVALYWNPVPGASSYNVYRSTTSGTEGSVPVLVNQMGTATGGFSTATVTGLTNGTTYYFQVTAVAAAGESAKSSEVSSQPNGTRPAAPVLAAVPGNQQVVLNWSSISGATYNVYRSFDNTNWSVLASGVSATTYTDTGLTNGATYDYYYVTAVNAIGEGTNSNTVSASPGVPTLAAPGGLRAQPSSGQVALYWNPVPGASSYNVYRSTTSGTEGSVPVLVNQMGTATGGFSTATVTGLTNGTTYYFQVTAVNGIGESAKSSEVSSQPNGTRPAAPVLAAVPGNQQVVLNWSSVSGATYNVYRSFDNTNWSVLASGVSATTYTDTGLTNGATYDYYYVTAVNAIGEGTNSNTVSASPGVPTLAAPTGLIVSPSASGQLTLYWNPVTPPSTVVGYNVYRGTSSGGEGSAPIAAGITATSNGLYTYTDTGLTNGTTYYYYVTTVSSVGESAHYSEASGTPAASAMLSAPTLSASASGQQINLTWTSVTGASTYVLFRSTDNVSFTLIQQGLTGTSYSDTGLANNTKYYYFLAAVNANGKGTNSATVNATTAGLALSAPSPIVCYWSSSGGYVGLRWNAVPGASSFNIYRGTIAGGEGTTPYASGVTTVDSHGGYYQDTGYTTGSTYYYTVTAVNAIGESAHSVEVSSTVSSSTLSTPVLTAVPGNGQVTLNWSSVSGASSYFIWRAVGSGSTMLLVTGLTSTTYTDTSVTNGVVYSYEVEAKNPGGLDPTSATLKVIPGASLLSAPSPIVCYWYAAGPNVNLRWNTVSGASSYNIYRGTTSGGEGATPYATGVTTSDSHGSYYQDSSYTTGTTYYYTVTAVNGVGEGAHSVEVSATVGSTSIAAPVLTAVPGNGQVTLNWSSVSGASSYFIWRSVGTGSTMLLATGLTGTSYTDTSVTNGIVYGYEIEAKNPAGPDSQSAVIKVIPGAPLPPAPTLIYCYWSPSGSYVGLRWNPAPGASSYNIYRGTTSGGEGATPYATGVTTSDGHGIYYQDTGYTSGTTYYYTITSVNTIGESAHSAEVSAQAGSALLSAPILTATPGNGQVTLNWSSVSGASTYIIFRSVGSGSMVLLQTGLTGTSYVDTAVTNGIPYTYEVSAVNTTGQGSWSSAVQAIPGAAAPPAPTGLYVVPSASQLTLTWGLITGMTYNVYRGTTSGGEGVLPIASVGSGGGYTDTNVTAGTTYYYKVTALGNGAESPQSAEASGTPGATRLVKPLLSATANNVGVILNWSFVTGATGYEVFRSYTGSAPWTLIAQPGPTGLTYTDTNVVSGQTYYYQVYGVDADGLGNGSNIASGTPGTNYGHPPAPFGLRITPASTQLTLTWNAVAGAASYNVYRGAAAGGEGSAPYATGVGTSSPTYTDTGVTSGVPYYYFVTAVTANAEGPASNEVSGTPGATGLTAPGQLTAHAGSGLVNLQWNTVQNALSYNVYRSYDGSTWLVTQQNVTTGAYTDSSVTNGTLYYYAVTAVYAVGESGKSNVVSAVPGSAPLPAPTGLRLSVGTGSLTLTWDPLLGATLYNIYRATASGTEGGVPFRTQSTLSTTFTDSTVQVGTQYYYEVSAVNSNGEGPVSNEVSGTAGSHALAAPTNLVARGSSGQVALSWSASNGATSYSVYRSLDGTNFTRYAGNVAAVSYTDTGVTNGVTYWYEVAADNANNESAVSNIASATPGISGPTAPTGVGASVSCNTITVTWTAVTGATSYNLYRSLTSGGEGSVPIVTGITGTSYADNGCDPTHFCGLPGTLTGTPYYYTVTAVNNGGEGAQSAEATATVTSTFGVSASPSSVTITHGTSGLSQIKITANCGFNGVVNFTLSTLPAGITAWVEPMTENVLGGNMAANFYICVGSGVAPGNYSIVVTGTSGASSHTATVTVTVN